MKCNPFSATGTIAGTLASVSIVAILACVSPARAQVAGYSDVPAGHWAADSVRALVRVGILNGGSSAPLGVAAAAPPAAPAKVQPKTAHPVYNGNKPVTRYELAVTLYRFVQYIEEADSQRKTKFGAQAVPAITGPEAVRRLIADGYLPKNTPLAQNGTLTVTANQLADALSAVIAHSREKTTPISPYLKSEPKIEKPALPQS